jgi:hypothetical protein
MFICLSYVSNFVSAASIGVVNSQKIINVLPNTTTDEEFVVSRSDKDGDMWFSVLVIEDIDNVIKLTGGSKFKIPDGQNSEVYKFTLDTHGLEYGTYKTKLKFELVDDMSLSAGLAIKYGIEAGIKLNIVDHVEKKPDTINLSEEYFDGVVIEDFSLRSYKISSDKEIVGSVLVKNNSEYIVRDIPYNLKIYKSETEIYSIDKVAISDVYPDESKKINFRILSPDSGGQYNLRIMLAGNDDQIKFQIKDYEFIFYVSGLIISILIAFRFIFLARIKFKRS